MVSKSNDQCPYKKRRRHRDIGETACDNSTEIGGMQLRTPRGFQKLKEARKASPLETGEGTWAC